MKVYLYLSYLSVLRLASSEMVDGVVANFAGVVCNLCLILTCVSFAYVPAIWADTTIVSKGWPAEFDIIPQKFSMEQSQITESKKRQIGQITTHHYSGKFKSKQDFIIYLD